MDETPFTAHAGPIEMLAEWEGSPIYAPGVLLNEAQVEQLARGEDAAAMADWIAITAMSGFPGHKASESNKNKVRGILRAWRQRHGQAKLDEVKAHLIQRLQDSKDRKLRDDELRERA
jgi:hypothetical protein